MMYREESLAAYPKARIKNAAAFLQCATNLSGGFPYYLGEMGWLGVARTILRDFICPRFYSSGDVVATASTGSQVLPVRAEGSARMHEFAAVCPFLSSIRQSIAPSQIPSTML